MVKRKAKPLNRDLTAAERARIAKVRRDIESELPEIRQRGRKYKHASLTARNIVNTLKAAREEQGVSLAGLKELTGMTREMVCALENNNDPNPTIRTLAEYAEAVGMEIVVVPMK
ncbi:MAG: helix-turn-helix domain-containing protein [Pirellulaceae bacterium]